MIIRRASAEDIQALSEVAQHSYTHTFKDALSTEDLAAELAANKSATFFKRAMEQAGDIFLIALKDDTLTGYIGLGTPPASIAHHGAGPNDRTVNGLYIHPDFQGQGIGRELMDTALSHPLFQAAQNIYLRVGKNNKRAYNFYIKYGFKPVGMADVVINDKIIGQDVVMMRPAIQK